jgi:hypothetical protein
MFTELHLLRQHTVRYRESHGDSSARCYYEMLLPLTRLGCAKPAVVGGSAVSVHGRFRPSHVVFTIVGLTVGMANAVISVRDGA